MAPFLDLPTFPTLGALPFVCELPTRWSDEDTQGVLNNAVYLTLFEEARARFFFGLGILPKGTFPFLLGQTYVRFLSPGRGGESVTVRLATTRIGTSSFEQIYRVVGPDGTIWCEGGALLVCYDPHGGGSRPMDPGFRARLEQEGFLPWPPASGR